MENIEEVKKKATTKKAAPKKAAVKTKIDPKTGTLKVVEKKTTPKKETTTKTKKATSKKTTTKKSAEKEETKKTTSVKQPVTIKKSPARIIKTSEPTVKPVEDTPVKVSVEPVISNDVVDTENNVETIQTPEEVTPIITELDTTKTVEPVKKRGRKPSENPLPKVSSKSLTIEPPKREPKNDTKKEKEKALEPEVIQRPTPKKTKVLTKEEKVLYKKLLESFNYVANLTNVVEEKTMDTKLIQDLTIGELHVIEMVDQNNNKPMSLIAKKLKVTVGSLTICINRLVQKGYLLRIRHEMDHRIILVSTTQKAKKVLKEHDKFHENIIGLALEKGITLQQATKVMSQFAMVLEYYYDPKSIKDITETPKKKGSKE